MLHDQLPRAVALACLLASVCVGLAQDAPPTGHFVMTSGTFTECCGFAGIPFTHDLPDVRQRYVRLAIDEQSRLATLTFLGPDLRTVVVGPCPVPGNEVVFRFENGVVRSDRIVFQADPGPPPLEQDSWLYTVTWVGNALGIEGTLNAPSIPCFDVSTHFEHTVTAVQLPTPRLAMLDHPGLGRVRLRVQGQAGWRDVIEASTDLVVWTGLSTNIMDYSLCPICPYADVEDPSSTNAPSRFYRAYELP